MGTNPSSKYIQGINTYMKDHWLKIGGNLHHERHQNRILYTASFCRGNTVEIGSADGTSTQLIKESMPSCVVSGVEPTDAGYTTAVQKYPAIKFYKAYAENLPFHDSAFDTVLLPEVIEHCEDPMVVIKECWRVACFRFIITHPVNIAGQRNDPTHVRFITFDQMRKMVSELEDVFEITHYGLDKTGQIVDDAHKNESKVFFGITLVEKK